LDLLSPKAKPIFSTELRSDYFAKIDATWDYQRGGRRGAPKFPMPVVLSYLLQNAQYTGNQKALAAVTTSLDHMLAGGIYDQVGGGFARYSVDADWRIPHFEKMLYDNAQLVSLYSQAYLATRDERYKAVVVETLAWLERDLSDPNGGWYASLDADSEGVEGKYYVWSIPELNSLLGDDFKEFIQMYEVPEQGNFEGAIHLRLREIGAPIRAKANHWKELLIAHRTKRIPPALDDKQLTSWNALMIKGYVEAYLALGDKNLLTRAIKGAHYIQSQCTKSDGSLYRNYNKGKASINAFLDDYSFTIEAYLSLYQASLDIKWLTAAKAMADYAIAHFYDTDSGLFFYTSDIDSPLISRKVEMTDNVIPSSNSSMAHSLVRLGIYYAESHYTSIAQRQLQLICDRVQQHTAFYAYWAALADRFISPSIEVAVVGEDAQIIVQELQKHYQPACVYLGTTKGSDLPLLQGKYKAGETWIYLCSNRTCLAPVETVAEALSLINQIKVT
jgi:hypothetical protein